ncbi:uncharacterized protein LOC143836825 isoform X1 [Paroedura picta]|uniref:uncharacterized protein LOC143836825 isoform X1 n=1 Tax=Paroedura picta TaxID=143630 RepID=UPI0040566B18
MIALRLTPDCKLHKGAQRDRGSRRKPRASRAANVLRFRRKARRLRRRGIKKGTSGEVKGLVTSNERSWSNPFWKQLLQNYEQSNRIYSCDSIEFYRHHNQGISSNMKIILPTI